MERFGEFIEAMGLVSEMSGLPRTQGRIAGLLMVSEEPVSFSELAERLGVSRGSVSTSTRALLQRGVIERVEVEKARETFFQSSSRPPYRDLLEQQQVINKTAIDAIGKAASRLSGGTGVAALRLARHRMFLDSLNTLLQFHITLLDQYESMARLPQG